MTKKKYIRPSKQKAIEAKAASKIVAVEQKAEKPAKSNIVVVEQSETPNKRAYVRSGKYAGYAQKYKSDKPKRAYVRSGKYAKQAVVTSTPETAAATTTEVAHDPTTEHAVVEQLCEDVLTAVGNAIDKLRKLYRK